VASTASTAPSASASVNHVAGPPPAALLVQANVSATTVPYGGSVTVTYSWSDGDGQVLAVNHVESSASKIVRPPACVSAQHTPRPSSGHGTYVFTVQNVGLIAGLSIPFDHPQRIRVGLDLETGGGCAAVEQKSATQWVTLLPPVAAPVVSLSPSAAVTSTP
jgi:hypothetical protein